MELYNYPMYTVLLYNFSCHDNGRKNHPGPCNHDVLHRPLCEASDKIPKGVGPLLIFSVSLGVAVDSGEAEAMLSVKFSPVSFF